MKAILSSIAVVLVLASTACTAVPTDDRPYRDSTESADVPLNPAVVSLQKEADRQLASGNVGLAANALERAIRISPRDARLRQQLAAIRLRQGDPVQAKSLARMAVAFGRSQPDVEADAWEIIGRAESRLGNRREADLAFEEARRLRDEP